MTYQPQLISLKKYGVLLAVAIAMGSCQLSPVAAEGIHGPAKGKNIPFVSSIVRMDFITPKGVQGSGTKAYHGFHCKSVMQEMNTWIYEAIKRGIFKKARAKCYPLRGA